MISVPEVHISTEGYTMCCIQREFIKVQRDIYDFTFARKYLCMGLNACAPANTAVMSE